LIQIVSRKQEKGGIYVGRPTPLGNPFVIGVDGSRSQIIGKYRFWLVEKLLWDSQQRQALEHLVHLYQRGMVLCLACWCAPQACHAEVIREAILARAEGMSWDRVRQQLLGVVHA